MPKFRSPSIDTPARIRLAELLESRSAAAADMREAQSRIDRLSALATAPDKPRTALAALDASEAAAFAEWSKDPSAPAPDADGTARVDLTRELVEAQAKSDAAARAVTGMSAEMEAAAAKVAAVERQLHFATATVALEELESVTATAREAMSKMADARTKGKLFAHILANATADPLAPGFAEFSPAFAEATGAMTRAFDLPMADEQGEIRFAASVTRLLNALRSNPGARLIDEAA